MDAKIFSQDPYRCSLDWGRRGAEQAVDRNDILVIVDTLSFSTAVACAVSRDGHIYPCARTDDVAVLAQQVGGEAAVSRRDVPEKGKFSLSPQTYQALEPGTKVVLASPNGATCSRLSDKADYLFAGALVNAEAIATTLSHLLKTTDQSVTVIACGERSPHSEGPLRMAIEDYLGAGAILSQLDYDQSPEAQVCAGAFLHAESRLAEILWDCGSGRELQVAGYGADVDCASQLNLHDGVPMLQEKWFTNLNK